MHVLKVAFLKLAWKVLYPVKNCPAVFEPRSLVYELLIRFSYHGLGGPMDFIPRDLSSYSFHTLDNLFPPRHPALKKTPTQVFSCKVCETFKNTYFEEHLRTTAFVFLQCSRLTKIKNSKIMESLIHVTQFGNSLYLIFKSIHLMYVRTVAAFQRRS